MYHCRIYVCIVCECIREILVVMFVRSLPCNVTSSCTLVKCKWQNFNVNDWPDIFLLFDLPSHIYYIYYVVFMLGVSLLPLSVTNSILFVHVTLSLSLSRFYHRNNSYITGSSSLGMSSVWRINLVLCCEIKQKSNHKWFASVVFVSIKKNDERVLMTNWRRPLATKHSTITTPNWS